MKRTILIHRIDDQVVFSSPGIQILRGNEVYTGEPLVVDQEEIEEITKNPKMFDAKEGSLVKLKKARK